MKLKTTMLFVLIYSVALASQAADLKEQIEAVRKSGLTAQETTIHTLLKQGLQEHRGAEVAAAAQPWLQANQVKNPEVLYLAGVSAELAGAQKDAVTYYRKLLSDPNVNSALAAKAGMSVYRLMITHMQDADAAYLFMRQHGNRLRAHGRLWKFDEWFLREAGKRKDYTAAIERLTAILNGINPDPAEAQRSLNRTISAMESLGYGSTAVLSSLKKLARAKGVTPAQKARLLWIVEIVPLNAKISELHQAKKEVPASLYSSAVSAASDLISVDPVEGSKLVARGWCHFDDSSVAEKARLHVALKSPMLFNALAVMTDAQVKSILATSSPAGVDVGVVLDPVALQRLVAQKPAAFNSLTAPDLPYYTKGMTPAVAAKMAPHLGRNPHVHAAVVRAVAKGHNSFIKAANYIAANEMWRFSEDYVRRGNLSRFLWDCGLERDGDFRKMDEQLKKSLSRSSAVNKALTKGAKAADINTAQRAIVSDLLSPTPSIPGALDYFDRMANQGDFEARGTFISMLVTARLSGDREHLFNRAIQRIQLGFRGGFSGKELTGPRDRSGWKHYASKNAINLGKHLAPNLQKVLKQQMQSGNIHGGVLGLWIRVVEPGKGKSFMQEMVNSPAWAKVDSGYLALAKHSDHFGSSIRAPQKSKGGNTLSRELLALSDKPSAEQVKSALSAVINRAAAEPGFPVIEGLEKAAKQPAACIPFAKAYLNDYAPLMLSNTLSGYRAFAGAVADHALKTKQYHAVQYVSPSMWHVGAYSKESKLPETLTKIAEAAFDSGDYTTSMRISLRGVPSLKRAGGRHYGWHVPLREKMKALIGKNTEAMGVVRIQVAEDAPGYSIFLSQKEYMLDNPDGAWALYDEHADELWDILQKLRLDYCFWLLERNVEVGEVDRVEKLVQGLTIWDRRGDASLSLEQQALMRMAFAKVAFQKRAFGVARAWYRKITDNSAYNGSPQQHLAILGIVAIDREEKNYDDALRALDKLILIPSDQLRLKVRYARAQIFFAQEKYAEAGREIESILQAEPDHADAKLLQGKVQMAKRDLVSPSKIRIGIQRSTKAIEPGKRIEIDLKDPALSVSGDGMIIEVEARSASGDVERMPLRAVDEKRTLYRAEVKTELGAARPGDKVLQVLGRDTITYGFSKRFRETMKDLPDDPGESVMIASDFHLAISAGDFPLREGERSLTIEELGMSTAGDKALGVSRLRPGNPVYVRVVDPDQSRTAGQDIIKVDVRSSSGDSISSFPLQETAAFSGIFEGVVPTAGGQAVAYAYDSEPGLDPNMAISPRTDYPGWQGRRTTKTSRKFYSVNLNDVVDVKTMSVTSPESAQLKRFLVQTSRNGKTWDNVGCFPESADSLYDGRPFLEMFDGVKAPDQRSRNVPDRLRELGNIGSVQPKAYRLKSLNKPDTGVRHKDASRNPRLFRFRAVFYQPELGERRFQVKSRDDSMPGFFLIDGKPSADQSDRYLIAREFTPGLHQIDLWFFTVPDTLRHSAQLLCDNKEGEMTVCSERMFDPASFPPAVRESMRGLAKVREDGPGSYTVEFGKNSRTQYVRLSIGAHAGEAPGIKRLALADVTGKSVLPVQADYQSLRKNQQLEVLPGDTVMVKYIDDLTYSETRSQQEKQLEVAYNNGDISASLITIVRDKYGNRQLEFKPFRRFKMGSDLAFVVTDLDMDVSNKRDIVPFTVKTSDGKTREYKAFETEAHSGIFVGKVFPQEGAPTRESEIQLSPGGTLTATYRDMENLDPGVPADRSVTVEHAKYMTPKFGVYTAEVEPLEFLPSYPELETDKKASATSEQVIPRLRINRAFIPSEQLNSQTPLALYHDSVKFDVIATHLAISSDSKITAYVQTEAGRRAYAAQRKKAEAEGQGLPAPVQPFDVNVPGTLKVSGSLSGGGGGRAPDGYVAYSTSSGNSRRRSGGGSLDAGRFNFGVKVLPGDVPLRSFANKAAEGLLDKPSHLAVRPGDTVYMGYPYYDQAGDIQWYTASAKLSGHTFFDVTDGAYHHHLKSRFVGEKVFVRVISPTLDVSPERDEVTVQVQAASGATIPFTMKETFGRTGVFKGYFKLGILENPGGVLTPQEFFSRGLPVQYSDTVTVSLPNAYPTSFSFEINNGSDGLIESFSKQYKDSSVALKANFTLAECYFELAKMHRAMGKGDEENGEKMMSLSRREMAHAKKLLQEALATHQDPDQQAHAEYLLGNLSQEYADTAENEEVKDANYKDALARFSIIPVDYPDSPFAPKAQYKRALVYEKMGELEIAVEEYVKLGYKYPENEHIPEAMSRIGGFFQKRGVAAKKEADKLIAKGDDESLKMAGELMDSARRDFKWAATVFIRMMDRYPRHPLAGLAGVRAGQNRMRYGDNSGALQAFEKVYVNEAYDGPGERAQAFYWAGLAHERISGAMQYGAKMHHHYMAIAHYEITRYQFSASKWAKYARGRLAHPDNQYDSPRGRGHYGEAMAELQLKLP